ncbi:MAG: hypothetical protein AcusKO_00060 [Acuticoccus sp.]
MSRYQDQFDKDDYIYGTDGDDDWGSTPLIGRWGTPNVILAGDGDDVAIGAINGSGTGFAANNLILGMGGNDEITGASNFDVLAGGPGDDIISTGLGGSDIIYGNSGNDEIHGPGAVAFGGSGDDVFRGAFGRFEGGSGHDTFHAANGLVIKDFSAEDVLDFSETGAFLEDLLVKADKHGNTLVKFPVAGDEPSLAKVKLLGVTPAELGSDNLRIASGDDYPGNASTSAVLPIDGTRLDGESENAGDRDWFRIDLEGFDKIVDAQRVQIDVVGVTGFDPHTVIRDGEGNIVAQSPNYDYDDMFVVASEEGGSYYVDVGGFDEPGTYYVTATPYDGYQVPEII